MREFVTFNLEAPMGAFGGPAGVAYRPTAMLPGRSHILGLVGAALGIRREDAGGLARLRTLRVTVGSLTEGRVMRDFHTAQGVPDAAIRNPDSRRVALAHLRADDTTTISQRDYVTDGSWVVAIEAGDMTRSIVDGLNFPVFIPFAGRKSCPLAAQMHPIAITAADALCALRQRLEHMSDTMPGRSLLHVASDDAFPGDAGDCWEELERTDPEDRVLWHFQQVRVHHINLQVTE